MENGAEIIIVFLANPPDFAINSDAWAEFAVSDQQLSNGSRLAVGAVTGLKTE
jgi:hypothetical protein